MKEKKSFAGSLGKPKNRFTISKKGVEHGCCYRWTVRDSLVIADNCNRLFGYHPVYTCVAEAHDKSTAAKLCHALNATYGQSKRQVVQTQTKKRIQYESQ